MKEGKVVIINDLVKTVGGFVLNFAEPRVEDLLPDGSIQEALALSVFPPMRKSLIVLNDQDGANADQSGLCRNCLRAKRQSKGRSAGQQL